MTDPRLAVLGLSINDQLFDQTIRHAVLANRVTSGDVAKIMRLLNGKHFPKLLGRIQRHLSKVGGAGPAQVFQSRKAHKYLVEAINKSVKDMMGELRKEITPMMQSTAANEAAWSHRTMRRTLKGTPSKVRKVPKGVVKRGLTKKAMRGLPYNKWYDKLGRDTQTRLIQTINQGLAEGKGIDKIVRAIRGTRASGYTDGVLQATRREVTTLVRTAATHVKIQAKEAFAAANQDVIKGVRFVAVLDAFTTIICGGLDGKVFNVGEGERPPMHHQCRSDIVYVTKSWKEQGFSSKVLKKFPRARLDQLNGKVTSVQSYNTWLKRQPAAVQNEVLGVAKGKAFRRGEIKHMRDLVTPMNRPLTVGQMQAKTDLVDVILSAPPEQVGLIQRLTKKNIATMDIEQRQAHVKTLLGWMKESDDPAFKKTVRDRLRRLGHKGGGKGIIKPPVKPPPIKPPPPPEPVPGIAPPVEGGIGKQVREDLLAWKKSRGKYKGPSPTKTADELWQLEMKLLKAHPDGKRYYAMEWGDEKRLLRDKIEAVVHRDPRYLELNARLNNDRAEYRLWQEANATGVKDARKKILDLVGIPKDEGIELDFVSLSFKRLPPAMQKKANAAKDWLERIIPGRDASGVARRTRVSAHKLGPKDRAFCRAGREVHLAPSDGINTWVHEISHAVEDQNGWGRAAREAFEQRTRGESLQRLKDIYKHSNYGADEVCKPDKFYSAYMGKVYGHRGPKEMVSMALEGLYKDPLALAKKDPETFDWIINLVRGQGAQTTAKVTRAVTARAAKEAAEEFATYAAKAKTLSKAEKVKEVAKLLKQAKKADAATKKAIRAKLRKLGHKGGLAAPAKKVVEKVTPKPKVKLKPTAKLRKDEIDIGELPIEFPSMKLRELERFRDDLQYTVSQGGSYFKKGIRAMVNRGYTGPLTKEGAERAYLKIDRFVRARKAAAKGVSIKPVKWTPVKKGKLHYDEWYDSLTAPEKSAIRKYISGQYKNIQKYLATGQGGNAKIKSAIEHIRKAAGKYAGSKQGVDIFRGVSMPKDMLAQFKVGRKLELRALNSFSRDKAVAARFSAANEVGHTEVVFRIQGAKRGMDLGELAPPSYRHEQEVLVLGGHKYRVVRVTKTQVYLPGTKLEWVPEKRKVTMIVLKEV